jgi:hypothetical protein
MENIIHPTAEIIQNQPVNGIYKKEDIHDEIRSHLPQFGDNLHAFQKFIKAKYGFWVNAYFAEDGRIYTCINVDNPEVKVYLCRMESQIL